MGDKLIDLHSISRSARVEAILLAIVDDLYDGVLDYGETNVPYQRIVPYSLDRSSRGAHWGALSAADG
jgi:hypothetical protein